MLHACSDIYGADGDDIDDDGEYHAVDNKNQFDKSHPAYRIFETVLRQAPKLHPLSFSGRFVTRLEYQVAMLFENLWVSTVGA